MQECDPDRCRCKRIEGQLWETEQVSPSGKIEEGEVAADGGPEDKAETEGPGKQNLTRQLR